MEVVKKFYHSLPTGGNPLSLGNVPKGPANLGARRGEEIPQSVPFFSTWAKEAAEREGAGSALRNRGCQGHSLPLEEGRGRRTQVDETFGGGGGNSSNGQVGKMSNPRSSFCPAR